VTIGTTANQKKLFFKLRSAKSKIAALDSGDLHPDQVARIAKRRRNSRRSRKRDVHSPKFPEGSTYIAVV